MNYNNNNIRVSSTNQIYSASFYFEDFYNEKEVMKFIKATERLIRNSKEYKTYINSLGEAASILKNDAILAKIAAGNAKIEYHHYPFELSEIVEIVMNDKIYSRSKFTSFSIAREIIELHYKNNIGLVPLTTTNHELTHYNAVFIRKDQIFGEYDKFVSKYSQSITSEQFDRLAKIEELTAKDFPSDFSKLYEYK